MTPPSAGAANLVGVPVTPLEPERTVERTASGDLIVLTVLGRLDGGSGAALVRAVGAAVDGPVVRIDVDLSAITSFTPEGARWLLRCRGLSEGLPEGLHYRPGRGPGQAALLAAYADER